MSLESRTTPNACCKVVSPSLTTISTLSAAPDLSSVFVPAIHTSFFMFNLVSYCQGFSNRASPSFCLHCSKLIHLPCFFLSFVGLSRDINVIQNARTEPEIKPSPVLHCTMKPAHPSTPLRVNGTLIYQLFCFLKKSTQIKLL